MFPSPVFRRPVPTGEQQDHRREFISERNGPWQIRRFKEKTTRYWQEPATRASPYNRPFRRPSRKRSRLLSTH